MIKLTAVSKIYKLEDGKVYSVLCEMVLCPGTGKIRVLRSPGWPGKNNSPCLGVSLYRTTSGIIQIGENEMTVPTNRFLQYLKHWRSGFTLKKLDLVGGVWLLRNIRVFPPAWGCSNEAVCKNHPFVDKPDLFLCRHKRENCPSSSRQRDFSPLPRVTPNDGFVVLADPQPAWILRFPSGFAPQGSGRAPEGG